MLEERQGHGETGVSRHDLGEGHAAAGAALTRPGQRRVCHGSGFVAAETTFDWQLHNVFDTQARLVRAGGRWGLAADGGPR
eukprot:7757205-Pyramimonas_sp.AAC.1